ncbi:MAG TPA: sulfotransferase [Burkholderiales bacterium]|nr:sulfotransferase [Burkholderiales bacterium]
MEPGRDELSRGYEQAMAEFRGGDYGAASAHLQRLVERAPRNATLWTSLGAALQLLGRYEQARACYGHAIQLDPGLVDAHSNLGTVLQGLRRIDEAMASFRTALSIDPGHLDALAGVGALLDWQGRYAEGLELLEPFAGGGTAHPELVVSYARLLMRAGRLDEAKGMLGAALAASRHGPAHRQRMLFLLGDVCDALGLYDEAFAHYREGNALKQVRFEPGRWRAAIDEVVTAFTRPVLAGLPRAAAREPAPVFIVGMPRSGTSLAEQILASHPAVHAAGELECVAAIAAGLVQRYGTPAPYPGGAAGLPAAVLERMAADFRRAAGPAGPGIRRITDKTLGNPFYLGLIEMMFPNARIVYCRRDALDNGLSCYFQNFAGTSLPFCYDLAHIGAYHRELERLMCHWREASALPIHELVYEDLVTDQERATRALVDFARLDWDDRCLRFHELGRVVKTVSHDQVRRRLYASSMGRHRHYERYLGPLREALGDMRGEAGAA